MVRISVGMGMILFCATFAAGQDTQVKDAAWGVTFSVPAGWSGQKTGAGYLYTSTQGKTLLLLSPNQYASMEELLSQADAGINDENGTALEASTKPTLFGSTGAKVEYAGTVNGSPARAVAIGLLSRNGDGLNVLLIAEADDFSPSDVRLVESVARSVKFSVVKTNPAAGEWKEKLSHTRLTYISTYASGGGGGTSAQTEIHICRDGSFSFSSSSMVSLDVPGASGLSSGGDTGEGSWRVVTQGGQPVLELRFRNGEVRTYNITYPNNTLHLNGVRYFMTNDPACR